jgi:hypothetical protein
MSRASFIPSSVSLWNNLDLNIRNSPNIACLKSRINENSIKSPEYYSEGPRKLGHLCLREEKLSFDNNYIT